MAMLRSEDPFSIDYLLLTSRATRIHVYPRAGPKATSFTRLGATRRVASNDARTIGRTSPALFG
jgi:hypothetical protein